MICSEAAWAFLAYQFAVSEHGICVDALRAMGPACLKKTLEYQIAVFNKRFVWSFYIIKEFDLN